MIPKSNKRPSISIFFPCYNDSKSISKLIIDATEVAQTLTNNYEVIIIDDGSNDNSREVLRKFAIKDKHIKLIFHKKNLGYGGALRSGFKKASKELIFYTDGDGQYDVKELPILYSLMTRDTDIVNGIKMTRHDPTYRIFLGNLYSFVARWLFWLPTFDIDCDFRLIRNKTLKKINLKSNSGSICIELVKKLQKNGAGFRQVSIHHYERKFGESQFFRIDRIFSTFHELISLYFLLMIKDKFSKKIKWN